MDLLDHRPTAARMAALVAATPETALGAPTPCPAYTVGDLLDHIGGLAVAFTEAATKTGTRSEPPPEGSAANLPADWRDSIPAACHALAHVWQQPSSYEGMTNAGGIEMPGEVAAVVALEELLVHGWDLARATGQPFEPGPDELAAAQAFLAQFADAGEEARGTAFAAPRNVRDDAPWLDQVIALSGRNPDWSPG